MPSEKRCLVCRKTIKAKLVENYKKYSIYKCPDCRLQFASPLEYKPELYDAAYKGLEVPESFKFADYPTILNLTSNQIKNKVDWFKLWSNERLVMRWLEDNFSSGAYILDLGCGTGRFLVMLKKKGFYPLGMDTAPKPISMLKEKGFQVAVGTISDYPSDWPKPKAVTLLEVLEHLPNPVEFLKSISARFPQAPLILSVPSPRRWRQNWDKGDYPPHHLTRWTEKALFLALRKAGYNSKIIFTKIAPEDIEESGLNRTVNRCLKRANLDRRLSHFKKSVYHMYAAYLNFRRYSSYSMVAIAFSFSP